MEQRHSELQERKNRNRKIFWRVTIVLLALILLVTYFTLTTDYPTLEKTAVLRNIIFDQSLATYRAVLYFHDGTYVIVQGRDPNLNSLLIGKAYHIVFTQTTFWESDTWLISTVEERK